MTGENEMEVVLQVVQIPWGSESYCLKVKPLEGMGEFRAGVGRLIGQCSGLWAPLVKAFMEVAVAEAKRSEGASPDDGTRAATALTERLGGMAVGDIVADILPYLLGPGVDDLIKLAYLYDPGLKERADEATFEQRVGAGMEVLKIALPFVISLAKMMWKIGLQV